MIAKAERAKVLVIDDERGPRESLRVLLNREYDVLLAENVDEGVAMLREAHPDLIVMDIRMPGKTGIDGLRAPSHSHNQPITGIRSASKAGYARRNIIVVSLYRWVLRQSVRDGSAGCIRAPLRYL